MSPSWENVENRWSLAFFCAMAPSAWNSMKMAVMAGYKLDTQRGNAERWPMSTHPFSHCPVMARKASGALPGPPALACIVLLDKKSSFCDIWKGVRGGLLALLSSFRDTPLGHKGSVLVYHPLAIDLLFLYFLCYREYLCS